MTDLTKLTAEEILSVWPLEDDEIAEIRRRLELVEKLQHAARKAAIDIVLLKERLEKCEAAIRICRTCRCVLCEAARAALEE